MSSLAELIGEHEIVDLSVVLADDLPATWPGHVAFQHKVHNWYEPLDGPAQPVRSAAPYYTCWLVIDEHTGTHFDAPPHFVPPPDSGLPHAGPGGAEHGDRVPLADLQGPAAVVDVRDLAEASDEDGVSPRVEPDRLAAWEAEHGPFRPGDVVLLRTGWDRRYVRGADAAAYVDGPVAGTAPGWPAPSAEAVLHLHERGVRALGIDAPSVGAVDEGLSMHYAGLERGMRYVEGLAALDRLPPRGAYFVFLPLKVARSSGAAGRAIAYVPRAAPPRRAA